MTKPSFFIISYAIVLSLFGSLHAAGHRGRTGQTRTELTQSRRLAERQSKKEAALLQQLLSTQNVSKTIPHATTYSASPTVRLSTALILATLLVQTAVGGALPKEIIPLTKDCTIRSYGVRQCCKLFENHILKCCDYPKNSATPSNCTTYDNGPAIAAAKRLFKKDAKSTRSSKNRGTEL